MFDFQTRGRSWMTQGAREGAIEPGYGVLYDARRPFEDRLDGPGARAEVLIATVPAAALLIRSGSRATVCDTDPACRNSCARDRGAGSIALVAPDTRDEIDVVAYLAALLRLARAARTACAARTFSR